jgi:hypothetical protein
LPFWGYFFNEPTKSSLIGEKSPNLVTLATIDNRHRDKGPLTGRDIFNYCYNLLLKIVLVFIIFSAETIPVVLVNT